MRKLILVIVTMISMTFLAPAVPAFAASTPGGGGGGGTACTTNRFLTFPAWYRGLANGDCSLKSPKEVGGVGPYVTRIALNIVELMLQLVIYVAVGFIIYGGFTYLTSISDSPAKVTRARKMIQNAVIGIVISFFSIAIVNLIAGSLK